MANDFCISSICWHRIKISGSERFYQVETEETRHISELEETCPKKG